MPALFLYDLNSPFAYLAAERVDSILGDGVVWRPVAFAFILRATGRVPWSFSPEGREVGFAEITRRAIVRGLPEVVYPEGWPRDCYALAPLRVLAAVEDPARHRQVALELFRTMFVRGRRLDEADMMLAACERAGLVHAEAEDALASAAAKERLRGWTDEAIAAGVEGVPSVIVGDAVFWGDDRLEEAADAVSR